MTHIPRRKRFVYACILVVASIVLIEVALHIVYAVGKRRFFPFASYRSAIAQMATGQAAHTHALRDGVITMGQTVEALHPYFGFVRDPSGTPNTSWLGFPQQDDDPFSPCTNGILVAVCGGSFAQGVSSHGGIEDALRRHGIESRVVTLAMGGYKQPQQLAVLCWLLSHDAPIDVVVNLDGFNEVALPPAENLPKGVNPFYPRAWYWRTRDLHDRESLRLIGRGTVLESRKQQWANRFKGCASWSISAIILWKVGDRNIEQQMADVNEALLDHKGLGAGFITTGPTNHIAQSTLYDELAAHWKRCSQLMSVLCRAHDILYLHALQPNQYYEPGRALTPEEQNNAFREDHRYRPGVLSGYPMLIQKGKELLSEGVDFHDLTLIYHDIPEPIYIDDCCHPNLMGYRIVGQFIADTIAARRKADNDIEGRPAVGRR